MNEKDFMGNKLSEDAGDIFQQLFPARCQKVKGVFESAEGNNGIGRKE
jgi:hypothetical protein